jgi:hypothetical protein
MAAPTANSSSLPGASIPFPAVPAAVVSLLDLVPSKVAVSTTVDNPRDFPEHLVDGRMETAWNSKTGDLNGWVAFRVPPDVHVDRIELTVGFNKRSGAVDLFTSNHRITRVRIVRDKVPLKEVSLDPNVRELQLIPIDGPGGEYEVRVLQTLPGTNKAWRELVVSELRVMGTPGSEAREPDDPLRVVAGDLDAEPTAFPGTMTVDDASKASYASIDALCAANVARSKARVASMDKFDLERIEPSKPHKPSCREEPSPVTVTSTGVYLGLRAVFVDDGIATFHALVLETPGGFVHLPVDWDWNDPRDPGCPSIFRPTGVEELRFENGYLVAFISGTRPRFEPDSIGGGVPVTVFNLSTTWCKAGGKELECASWNPEYQPALGWKGLKETHWRDRKAFHVSPTGQGWIQE